MKNKKVMALIIIGIFVVLLATLLIVIKFTTGGSNAKKDGLKDSEVVADNDSFWGDMDADGEQSDSTEAEKQNQSSDSQDTTDTSDNHKGEDTDASDNVGRGTVKIADIYAWIGYPASDFITVFSKPQYAEKLTFSYDKSALQINEKNNTVKALKTGEYVVKASSKNFSTSFTVRAESVNKDDIGLNSEKKYYPQKYQAAADNRFAQWESNGNAAKTTVFIGDSFFDTNFWSNFYHNSYPGKDVLCLGISATTSYDWESWADGWLKQTEPKNIVMHMGTNNIYDDGDSVNTAVSSLQRMFTVMHSNQPNAKIYWFGISYRNYNTWKIMVTKKVNEKMKAWCDARDYITYINTPDKLTTEMLRDGIHPKVERYSVFVDALSKTDIKILDVQKTSSTTSSTISDINYTTAQMINAGTGNSIVTYKGEVLTRNYILSGKLDIKKNSDASKYASELAKMNVIIKRYGSTCQKIRV